MSRRVDPRLGAIALGLAVSVAGVALLELMLRIVDPDLRPRPRELQFPELFDHLRNVYHEPDPDLGWRLRRGYQEGTISTTEDGFREVPGATPGSYAVACMGNSVTFGYSTPHAHETYPAVVEELLVVRGSDTGVEVLNAGIVGYSSEQGRRLYASHVRPHRPGVVTLLYGFNDHHLTAVPDQERFGRRRAGDAYRSRVYRLVRKLLHERFAEPEHREVVHRVALDRFEENLRALVAAIRDDGAEPVLITVPLRPRIPLVENPVLTSAPGGGTRFVSPMRRLMAVLPEEARGPLTRLVFANEPLDPAVVVTWIPALEDLVAASPDAALAHHLLADAYTSTGQSDRARLHRDEAARWDRERRSLEAYNVVTREVAADVGARLVDLGRALDDGRYFDDVVHLSEVGNRRAGTLVAGAVAEALGLR
jgi:lysophospholipase L1-like esterase